MGYLEDTFGPQGYLSQVLPGYRPRPGQLEMARAVDGAIGSGRHLLVEGATGVGKSLAYGVPVTRAAHDLGCNKRALIATSSIPLQEQLVEKDLPLLQEALPWEFTFRMIKGKSNYLCLHRAAEAEVSQGDLFKDHTHVGMAKTIATWSTMTPDGDRSGLPFDPPHRVWREFSTDPEGCRGKDCGFKDDCFSLRARRELERADVVVANYHLLFAHLRVKEKTGRSLVLPEFDVLVMDEAHRAPGIARDFLGFRLSHHAVDRFARKLGGEDQALLLEASGKFFGALARHAQGPQYDGLLQQESPVGWRPLHDLLRGASTQFDSWAEAQGDPGDRAELRALSRQAEDAAGHLCEAMCLEREMTAYYVEEMKTGVALRAKRVDVGDWLRENLWDNVPTIVATSATMAVDGSMDFVAGELGADHCDELVVDSPFRWDRRALLVLPEMPDPRDRGYLDAVARAVEDVVRAAGGRTLALFTSWRALNHVHRELAAAGLPHRVLKQGDAPRTSLVEMFREDVGSVLLGTESFWSGIDVPGESLSCVVVDKLPFASYGDPVIQVLKGAMGSEFFGRYYVPAAAMRLRQGAGRLIRSEADYGVVVVLDPRVVTKGYGRSFQRSLPRMVKTRDLGVIGKFLGDMRDGRKTA